MKTILVLALLATAALASAQTAMTPEERYAAYTASLAASKAANEARAAERAALAQPRSEAQLDELINQMTQLRIQEAYPNNPAMWRYLNNNPRYIPYYLGR